MEVMGPLLAENKWVITGAITNPTFFSGYDTHPIYNCMIGAHPMVPQKFSPADKAPSLMRQSLMEQLNDQGGPLSQALYSDVWLTTSTDF